MSAEQPNSQSSAAATPTTPKKKTEKPPFKLCFSKQQETGRSDSSSPKITADFVTPKFYSRETENIRQIDVSKTIKQITKEESKVPKKDYRWPLLTSHTYGWWHDRGIRPSEARFNFHKKTSEMVSYQMRIYAEDKKLKGFGH